MKVVLDLDRLLAAGRIDQQEYQHLASLASGTTRQRALYLLLFAGIAMLCAGAVWLVPGAWRTAVATSAGLVLAIAALAVAWRGRNSWQPAATVLLPAGVVLAVFGLLHQDASEPGFLLLARDALIASLLTIFFALAGRSVLLVVVGVLLGNLAVLMLVRHLQPASIEPAAVVLIGSALLLAAAAVLRIRLLADPWRSMASAAAITAVTIVNLCFINLSLVEPVDVQWPTLANNIYALIWTFFLAGFGWLAFSRNRRWAVNMVALFVLIHFFGQWFRRFDASALSLLVAGAALLAVAGVVYRLNCRRTDEVS